MGWEEWFDLDLWTCDLKINRDHLLIESNPAPSLVLSKWRGQKILSGQNLVYRPTYWSTDSCNTICPLFQGGHKKIRTSIVKLFEAWGLYVTLLTCSIKKLKQTNDLAWLRKKLKVNSLSNDFISGYRSWHSPLYEQTLSEVIKL